jgi:hypothetical protein
MLSEVCRARCALSAAMPVTNLCVSECCWYSEGNAIVILCQFVSCIHTCVSCVFSHVTFNVFLISVSYGLCCITGADKIVHGVLVNAVRWWQTEC